MSQKNQHINSQKDEPLKDEVLSRMEIPFTRSKEEVWSSLSLQMNDQSVPELPQRKISRILLVAASLALLLATSVSYLRFHTTTILTADQTDSVALPDGSTVELGGDSKISFHPYWWKVRREVRLEGKGYFEVEKGQRFAVLSKAGSTEVLGTTFTVIARSNEYRVSCFSGSVKVKSVKNSETAVLTANEELMVDQLGNYNIRLMNAETGNEIILENGYFIFSATSIQEVFKQIETHYQVRIEVPADLDYTFSGNLNKEGDIDDVLSAICIPFDIDYEQISKTDYRILP